jgi:hypothetical protein
LQKGFLEVSVLFWFWCLSIIPWDFCITRSERSRPTVDTQENYKGLKIFSGSQDLKHGLGRAWSTQEQQGALRYSIGGQHTQGAPDQQWILWTSKDALYQQYGSGPAVGNIDQNRCSGSDPSPGEADPYSVVKFQI